MRDRLLAPYRRAPEMPSVEPWLERAGWNGADAVDGSDAVVAVHLAWGDCALGTRYLARDGEVDPWIDFAGLVAATPAVRMNQGATVFFFSDDSFSRVEGPGGVMLLSDLIGDGTVEPSNPRVGEETVGYSIAMEKGLVYRTRRHGLTVTAEIVSRAAPLAPPKRARTLITICALWIAALLAGTSALAVAGKEDERLEPHDRHDRDRTLLALAARLGTLGPANPTRHAERSRSTARYSIRPLFPLCCCDHRHEIDGWPPRGWAATVWDGLMEDDPRPFVPPWSPRRTEPRWRIHVSPQREEGSIAPDQIRRVAMQHAAHIRDCAIGIQGETLDHDDMVSTRFMIGGDGTVSGASVRQTWRDDGEFRACVGREIRGWHFAPRRDHGVVTVDLRMPMD